jgi:uncharacterized protein (DUF1778 family)
VAFSRKRSAGDKTETRSAKSSGTEKRKRGRIIGFRASEEERQQIEAAADHAGLTPSSYVRSRAIAAPTTRAVRRAPASTAQLARLLGLLGAVGGSIERMNTAGGVAPELQAAAIEEFRRAASAILQTLGRRPHDN